MKTTKFNKFKNKKWLHQKYWIENKTSWEMAEEINCVHSTILKWMILFKIPRKNRSESRKGRIQTEESKIKRRNKMKGRFLGEKNHSWKGGLILDKKGYLRRRIIGKGYIKEHQYVWIKNKGDIPKGYDIHHKDENKLNNKIENLQIIKHEKHSKITANNRWNKI